MEARLLLQQVLGVNRAWLIAHANDALQTNRDAEFQALLTRRLAGEPIAYLIQQKTTVI
jgi:release factor glutamine methyltransferase